MEKLTPKEEVKIMYGIFVIRYKRIESNTFIPGNINTTEMAMATDTIFETEQKAIDFLPIMKKLETYSIVGVYIILPMYIVKEK
jgi:hypothetical protein